jgi:D-glycero-alpha-D-manno-heptose-7-phosphate kinase
MIITKTPLRIPLGGGGTDLPEFATRFGGHLLTAAIDQHIYICVQPWFEDGIRISYRKSEVAASIDDIEHPVAREALRLTGITNHIEILSMAELPSNTGLGSSASYTVGLLKALYAYKGQELGQREAAELACHIQTDILHEVGGVQDQFAAAYGGILEMDIGQDRTVEVRPSPVGRETLEELENRLLYFYTGIRRNSETLQRQFVGALEERRMEPTEAMQHIKEIGYQVGSALRFGRLDEFGHLLAAHWEAKRHLSNGISNPFIDAAYSAARDAGALGGKLMGAGGGGFLMFYCPPGTKSTVRRAMRALGLREKPIRIAWEGSTVLLNLKRGEALDVTQQFIEVSA